MKLSFRSLMLSSAALCATAAFAANQARVNVPFSFTARGQSFPAGQYEVSLDSRDNFVVMSSRSNPAKQIIWRVEFTDADRSPALVRFDGSGSGYALTSIQYGTWATPNVNPPSRRAISATTSIAGQ